MPLAEKELIGLIRRMAGADRRRQADSSVRPTRSDKSVRPTRVGIGDDCAVLRLPRGHETLVTTDFTLEGIHFRRDWHPAESVGHRCLARGLSDIAAMGGEPVAAFLSLALAGFYQMFQTTRPLDGRLTALRAAPVPLHAELIFPLARNRQISELVLNAFSHFIPFPTGKNISRNNLYITLDRFRPKSFDCQTFWPKKAQNRGFSPGGAKKILQGTRARRCLTLFVWQG